MGERIRVLRVRTETVAGDGTAGVLERAGKEFDVETASDAEAGLARLSGGFDCVVSDYDLPDSNGVEFLEAVREQCPRLPFVLLTSAWNETVAADAITAGVTDYLPRDVGSNRADLLATRVRDAVNSYRARQAVDASHASPSGVSSETADGTREATLAHRFEAIFDNPMTLIGLLDPDGTVLEANSTALSMVDASQDDVAGEPFWETPWWSHSAELQDRLRDWIDRAADGEHVRFEADHPTPHGNVGTVDGLIHPIRDEDGTVTELLAVGRDVTERKRRERRLQRQKAKIETLHEVATEIESCSTATAVYELLVDAAEEVLEFDIAIADEAREDVLVPVAVSSEIDADQFYGETPIDAEDNLAAAAYRTGESSVVADLRDQDVAPADSVFRSALTVPIGEYGVFQSVTKTPGAFDDAEAELVALLVAHAREQLAQIETERQLREQAAELKRQNDRLAEFASVVSHDLRNPLNVAEGHLEAARRECESDHLDDVAFAIDRMSELLEDLLSLASQGDRVRDSEAVELAGLADQCWQTVDTADATLVVETERAIVADRSRLRQLLENLFANAVTHGGADVMITVGAVEDGFYVADDGPGIPESEREAVFESGYSTTEAGTGFGLGIVKQIVEAHGWSIAVTDGEDGGARFEITGVDLEG